MEYGEPENAAAEEAWLGAAVRGWGIVYLVFVLVVWWGHVGDMFIMHPWTGAVDAHGAVRKVIKVGDDEVELWHSPSPGALVKEPAAYVLFFVGNADRADRWCVFNAAQWGDKPVELVGMNYPGFGGSTGPARLAKIGPAALAAYDWVRARAGARPIFVQANSVGTTAALCVVARREVAGVTLQNPPPLRRLILEHHGWWNLWLLAAPVALALPGDLDSLANAGMAKAPAVFVLSDRDEIVPVAYQRMVYEAYAGEKRVIELPAATHNTGMDQAAWDEFGRGLEWLWGRSVQATASAPK